jgi:hypothetical protein
VPGDVTDGEDRRVLGAAVLVDEDAFVDGQPRLGDKLDVRHSTDADDGDIRCNRVPGGREEPDHQAEFLDRRDARRETELDVAGRVEVGHEIADLPRDDSAERVRRGLEDGHGAAEAQATAATSRPMKPAPITAKRMPGARRSRRASASLLAEVHEAGAVHARRREATRPRAGCQDEVA